MLKSRESGDSCFPESSGTWEPADTGNQSGEGEGGGKIPTEWPLDELELLFSQLWSCLGCALRSLERLEKKRGDKA